MNSQPKTDAELTETERAAVAIESRILSLNAAIYYLITALLVGGGVFVMVVFPNEARSGVDALDDGLRQMIRWLLYVPLGTLVIGAYTDLRAHALRGKLIKRPDFRS